MIRNFLFFLILTFSEFTVGGQTHASSSAEKTGPTTSNSFVTLNDGLADDAVTINVNPVNKTLVITTLSYNDKATVLTVIFYSNKNKELLV